jgi:hypothetical protein
VSFRRAAGVALVLLAVVSGCATTSSHRDIRPSCRAPAPLEGRFDPRAPNFVVELQPAADVSSVATDLAFRYAGFHPRSVFTGSTVLVAGEMTPQTVAALRCDAAVKSISHDRVLTHLF